MGVGRNRLTPKAIEGLDKYLSPHEIIDFNKKLK